MVEIYEIAVIGAMGVAGSMGALRAVLNNQKVLAFSGDPTTTRKSRGTWVTKVDNMPLMFDRKRPVASTAKETIDWLLKHRDFSKNFNLVKQAVSSIEKVEVDGEEVFEIYAPKNLNQDSDFMYEKSEESKYYAHYVLLCTGIADVQPLINGSIEPVFPYANVGHIDYCLRCDGHRSLGRTTGVIGHGPTAAGVAIILHERYAPPEMKIFLNGEQADFSDEQKELIDLYGIKIIPDPIVGINGDPKVAMESFSLEGSDGKYDEPVDFAFAMLGQIAYNELAVSLGAEVSEKGNVICNERGESSVAGLYVAGDLRDTGMYQIYTAWDQAVSSVDDIDRKLRAMKREKLLAASA